MKRFITSLLLLAIVPMLLQAHPIDREQARRIANEFLAQTPSNNSQGKRQAPSIQRELAYKELGMKNLYAFADDVNGGFVIVANDDCVEPVLAYSETDTFNPFTMPLSMQVMLLGYEQQLSSISPSNAPVRKAGEASEREAIPPLIQTTWHQYLPLKYNTPFNESAGQNTPVGCVALTLAQIMYYYQYPQGTTITIPAYTTGSGYEMPALPPTTFDYSKMHLNYDHVYEGDRETIDPNDPSLIEVTKLLMYAGCALQMNYSTMGSSAVFDPQVIAKYFDYDKGARYLMAGNYPHEVWEEMVYNELAAGRPIPYSAGAVLNQNHEFIIDGYDGHGYFHANIGEIGRGGFNGFFKLGVLNECHNQTSQVLFSGYNVYQAGIFGFQPNKGNDPVPSVSVDYGNYALPKADFTRKSAGEDFKDIELSASMKRYDNNGHTMDYGWGLYQNGLLKKELCSSTTDQEITSLNMKFNMGSQLADGTYQLFPIFRNHGAKEWELYFEHGYTTEDGTPMRHYTATIENNKLHIGVSSKEPNLNVNKVEYFAAYEGEKLNMRVWFTNNGTNYENLLMLWIDGELAAGVGAYVDPGLSDYIDFCTAAPTKGTHEIKVSADWEGKVIIYTDELTVTDPPECQLEAEVTAKGLIGSVVYKDLDVVCKITNTGTTTFADMIDAELSVDEIDENGNVLYRPETGYPAWRWARVWYLHLEPSESAEISFTMGKEIFTQKNYSYDLTILYNNNKDFKNLYLSGCFTYSDNDFINATSIALNKENLSMNLYETETLIATVLPENASEKSVTWSSSDNEVVLVTNKGELHACKAGKAVITAASVYNPEVTATCEVTVLQPVDYIYLDMATLLFDKIGATYQLTATVMPENAGNKSVTWASSDEAVCTVSQSGLVTSVGSGTATISATTVDGGKVATCEVTVVDDNGILVLETGDMQDVRAIYDVTGRKMEYLQQGLNILLLNDGSIKKVILKE